MTLEEATESAIDDARAKAEIAIEKILLGLDRDTMRRIGHVNVDTRNFANYNVEIFWQDEAR